MAHGSRIPCPKSPSRKDVLKRLYLETANGTQSTAFLTLCKLVGMDPTKCEGLKAHLLEYQLIEVLEGDLVRITDKGRAQRGL